jgi:stage V sporulation protein AF
LEVDVQPDMKTCITAVLSGSILLVVEGYEEGIIIDARTYPTRSMQEPEEDTEDTTGKKGGKSEEKK